MKITKLSILMVIIMLPFMFIQYNTTRMTKLDAAMLKQVDTAFVNAINDGMTALRLSATAGDYQVDGKLRVDPMEAVGGLVKSLSLTLCVPPEQVLQYVPVILFVDYDGFYLYRLQEVEVDGQWVRTHRLSPKYYFTYSQGNEIIQLTLGQEVTVIDRTTGVRMASVLSDLGIEESEHKQWMVEDIQQALADTIASHNALVDRNSTVYEFYLPAISDQKYTSLLEDISVMAIFQGKKVGRRTVDLVGLENAALLHRQVYVGFKSSIDGRDYYCREQDQVLASEQAVESFASAQDAADRGYYPYNK